jgi:hypothetical protein
MLGCLITTNRTQEVQVVKLKTCLQILLVVLVANLSIFMSGHRVLVRERFVPRYTMHFEGGSTVMNNGLQCSYWTGEGIDVVESAVLIGRLSGHRRCPKLRGSI